MSKFQLETEDRNRIKSGDKIEDFKSSRGFYEVKKCVPESFKKVARAILDGHFEVSVGGKLVREIYPAYVEMYYHEESGIDVIKDNIVYHRNKPTKKFNNYPSLFKCGVINAHQSGVDITFEHEANINGEKIQVRASALIRGFRVEVKNSDYDVDTVDIDVSKVDRRSTYFYNALFSNLPVFEGFSIKWVDGSECNKELVMDFRKNVKDGCCWQSSIKENDFDATYVKKNVSSQ